MKASRHGTAADSQLALHETGEAYYMANGMCGTVLRIGRPMGDLECLRDDAFKKILADETGGGLVTTLADGRLRFMVSGVRRFEYVIGMAEIHARKVLILVSEATVAMRFDMVTVFKIKTLHFLRISEDGDQSTKSNSNYDEEVNRISRLYTKYGYFARGSNISNPFIDIVQKQYTSSRSSHMVEMIQTSLVEMVFNPQLDKNRRREYSANYHLIVSIEACMNDEAWMFDTMFVDLYMTRDMPVRLASRVGRYTLSAGR